VHDYADGGLLIPLNAPFQVLATECPCFALLSSAGCGRA